MSSAAVAAWQRMRPALGRLRVFALLAGCALLFWQYDGAPADWLFAVGIAASGLLWTWRRPTLDVAWPQVLVLAFVAVTVVGTLAAGGSLTALLITVYLVALSLTLANVLREDLRRLRMVEGGLILSGVVAALLTCLGYASHHIGWQPLELLAYDSFRGMGLFKDPNVAGVFTACVYPFAAARAARARLSVLLLPPVTAVFGLGVIFSFSREALLIFALAILGVIVSLAMTRRFRPILSLAVVCVVAVLSAGLLDRLPAYRGYELLAAYDQNGRFVVWRFGIDMLREAPLGTGAGSFEERSTARFDEAVNSLPVPLDTTNMVAPPPVDDVAGFHSSVASMPSVVRLAAGAVSDPLTFSFRNIGERPWIRGVPGQEARLGIGESGLVLEAGASPVIARFSHVDDRTQTSLDAGWVGPDRVATQVESEVRPGAEGTFTFQVRAPRQAGVYRLHLRPVIDGVTWMEEEGVVLEIAVTSTVDAVGASLTSTAPSAGGELIAPLPPSAYTLPGGALEVSNASQLVRALADPSPRDIVLANGSYDSSEPFYNPYGHRLYAASLGGAVLRAGLSLGANEGPGNGVVRGLAFDVDDPAKTLANSVVNIWGSGAGSQVMDVTITGHGAIANGIVAQSLDRLSIHRVVIRDVADYGVVVLSGPPVAHPIVLEDLDIAGVRRAVPGSSEGKAESCVWLGNTATVRRAMVRSCGFAGIWTGAGNTGSLLEHIDIDGARAGVYVEDTASQLSVRYLHAGNLVSNGVVPVGVAMRQPGGPLSAGGLVVVPSAHNTYVRVAAESGVLGFMAFVAYLILVFWSLWSRGWRDHWGLNLAVGLVLIAGFGIDTLHWRQLWLYLGIVAAVGVRNPAPVSLSGRTRRLAKGVAVTARSLGALRVGLRTLIARAAALRGPAPTIALHARDSGAAPAETIDVLDLRAELLRRDAVRAQSAAAAISAAPIDAENTPQGPAVSARRTALKASVSISSRMLQLLRRLSRAIVGRWRSLHPVFVRTVAMARDEAVGLQARVLPHVIESLRSARSVTPDTTSDEAVPPFELPGPDLILLPVPDSLVTNAHAELADEDLQRARSRLAAKQTTLGHDHPEVAAELHLIGAIHHDAQRYTEAVAFYAAALAIRERVLGRDHPEVASTLEDLAQARREEGEAAEAQALLSRAQEIRSSRRPNDHAHLDAIAERSLAAQATEDAGIARLQELLGRSPASRRREHED